MKHCPACQSHYPDDFSVCPRDGLGLLDSALWSPGSVVKGKYRIIRPAGYGAMAAVYEARHIAFDESRAIKVMRQGDPAFARRFVQEAQLTRRLQHPNAVRVEDIETTDDGRPFIIMEFIAGPSIREVLKHGPMRPVRVCKIAKQIAAALGAAHKLGIVHRDIKPSNILLTRTPDGEQVKVVDFGIARIMKTFKSKRDQTLTTIGDVIGTPAYMSPEQAAGNPDQELDGRSDIYSLGVVMYQMLSGQLPVIADSDSGFLRAHVSLPPVPLKTRCPNLPVPLTDLVMSCLSKQREHRPATAEALVTMLERWDQSEPAPSPTVVKAHVTGRSPSSRAEAFLPLGWFAVLWFVESLARDSASSPIPWLFCGASLGTLDLCLRRGVSKRLLALHWALGAIASAAFAHFVNPRLTLLWSLLVEPFGTSNATVQAGYFLSACLTCILIGNLPLLSKSRRAYAAMLTVYLVVSALELTANLGFANLAIAGALALLIRQRLR